MLHIRLQRGARQMRAVPAVQLRSTHERIDNVLVQYLIQHYKILIIFTTRVMKWWKLTLFFRWSESARTSCAWSARTGRSASWSCPAATSASARTASGHSSSSSQSPAPSAGGQSGRPSRPTSDTEEATFPQGTYGFGWCHAWRLSLAREIRTNFHQKLSGCPALRDQST